MADSQFGGMFPAIEFAYGVHRSVAGLKVTVGNTATGAGIITIGPWGYCNTADGRQFFPLSVTAPIILGTGASQETLTPTAVSQNADGSWSLSATFANIHSQGELVSSGTIGLAEAVNYVHFQRGGGVVTVDGLWATAGGVNSVITTTKGWTNVSVIDTRGTVAGSAFSFKAASNGTNMVITTQSLY